jgi:hypothetical protein
MVLMRTFVDTILRLMQLFVFPVFNLRLPEVTRTLLLYRFYRLDAARDRAKQVMITPPLSSSLSLGSLIGGCAVRA